MNGISKLSLILVAIVVIMLWLSSKEEINLPNPGWKMIRVKRSWVPEWLFSIMASPIDFITPKWLPFRYILTEKCDDND